MSDYEPKITRRVSRIPIRGIDYAVNEWGDSEAPLLVYLHGWGDAGATFQFVVDELRRDWFVVAPDWRGFGGSSSGQPAYWFPDYLADLDHLLAAYSPAQPARLIGHSMGGNVAGLYAGAMPERVLAFMNLEGFGLLDADPGEAPRRYRSWIQRSHDQPSFSSYASFDELARKIRKRSSRMSSVQALYAARAWAREDDDGRVRLRADPAHNLPNPVLYRRAEAEACWRAATAEVRMIIGRDSEYIDASVADFGADTTRLPFSRQSLHWIEGAGHMLHFDRPAEIARHIDEFFGL